MPPSYVRVTDETGWSFSVVEGSVEPHMTVLDEPASDVNGEPLPPSAPPTKTAKSGNPKKENR